ncbi:hypothetical protein [Lachnoclostridium phytofermentans]|uniref:hypothetical protein n=1 Tax=Lachnoclostridium phytofermentans TaxID=66219 RepID=UPI0000D80896|nr:hypothetical protein [Lachnoclostridium phytofermentans]
MKKTYCDELKNSIKIEIPELEVEWSEIDNTKEYNKSDLNFNPEQGPNNFMKNHKWKKYKLHITIAGVLLSIILILGFLCYENYGTPKSNSVFDLNTLDNLNSYWIKNDNRKYSYLILDDDANVLYEKSAFEKLPYQYPIFNEKIHWYLTEENKLFYLTSKGTQLVAENVIEFIPSRDCLKIFYIVSQDNNSFLYEYKLEDGSSVLIDNNVVEEDFCISPDSNIIVYQKNTAENKATETYFYVQGKNQLKGTNMIPIALTNEATLFYYVQNENLFVQSNSSKTQLMKVPKNDLSNIRLLFNQFNSELQYYFDNTWYLSTNGNTGEKLSEYEISS